MLRTLCRREVPAVGLGCMNLSHAYGHPPSKAEAEKVLAKALDLGIVHFDSAALYGFGRNEELVGPYLKPHRDKVLLASKCGMRGIDGKRVIDNDPALMRQDLEDSLRRLDTDVIDLFYLHRWDKKIPIEDTVGLMSRFVEQGHVRAIGLSEVSGDTIRKAHAVHPIAAVQSEYSPWSRNVEISAIDACAEIGAAFVAFSPLARGFLTAVTSVPDAFAEKDIRRNMPRFQEPHFTKNSELLGRYREIAADAGCSEAQLSIAWVLSKAPHIHAIPGTTSTEHLEEDYRALDVTLSANAIAAVDALINEKTISGTRYPSRGMSEVDTEDFAAA